MQAFIEKAKGDTALMAKLNEVGSSGAGEEEVVALAAEHGFTVTAEDYREAAAKSNPHRRGELAEEELDSVAGGNPVGTQNRWNPEVCNKYTRTHYNCVGFMKGCWCDHYSANRHGSIKYRHVCSMGRFDYIADVNGN